MSVSVIHSFRLQIKSVKKTECEIEVKINKYTLKRIEFVSIEGNCLLLLIAML